MFKGSVGSFKTEGRTIVKDIIRSYSETTTHKLKLIDIFIGFTGLLSVLQLIYFILFGRHPLEAFLAGFFTTLGAMIFTICLRAQLNPNNQGTIKTGITAVTEYLCALLLLYLAALNYMP